MMVDSETNVSSVAGGSVTVDAETNVSSVAGSEGEELRRWVRVLFKSS